MWIPLFLIVLYHRDQITVENIVNYTPGNQWLAVAVMLVLFALKGSLASVIYGGNLFAASGIMFPFPILPVINGEKSSRSKEMIPNFGSLFV